MNEPRDCLSSRCQTWLIKHDKGDDYVFPPESIRFGNKAWFFPAARRCRDSAARADALSLGEALSYLRRARGSDRLPIFTPWKHLASAERDGEGRVGWHRNGNSLPQPRSPERVTPALACQSSDCFAISLDAIMDFIWKNTHSLISLKYICVTLSQQHVYSLSPFSFFSNTKQTKKEKIDRVNNPCRSRCLQQRLDFTGRI